MSLQAAQIIIGSVAALALAGGGFVAGRSLAPSPGGQAATTTAAPAPGTAGRRAQGPGAVAALGGQLVNGRILSVNPDSITVTVRQAGPAGASPTTTSTIVLVGPSTRMVKTVETEITLADLKANDQVTIVGTTDTATGTVNASAIVVGGNALQQFLGGQLGGGQGGRPGASPTTR